MPKIFVAYRRDDSAGYAISLHDRLCTRFGSQSVFMDVDSIQPGEDWVDVIRDRVGVCDVLLAVIGPRWLNTTDDAGQRRLDDPEDFVRLEILAAVERKIRLIPVLVGGAQPPKSRDLPSVLEPLARRQAVELRIAHFKRDTDDLIESLASVPGGTRPQFFESLRARISGSVKTARERNRLRWANGTPAAKGFAILMFVAAMAIPIALAWIQVPQKQETEEVRRYRQEADRGDAEAITNLGLMYLNGRGGLPQDDVKAVELFSKAANQGDARAITNLGFMYETGRGRKQDAAEAEKWFRKAAELGHPDAAQDLRRLQQR